LKKYFKIGLQFFGKKKYYALTQSEREADIYIFGDITSWEWLESDISSYTLAKEIAGLDVDYINVHINSYGGEVAEGLAIFNMLRNHKAKIKTICDGFACSIASVIFMAGDERVMNSASLIMIHNAWTYAVGNSAQLRKEADDLDVISQGAIAAYMSRISISEDDLKALLDAESWILPADALEMGFATSIIGAESNMKAAANARKTMYEIIKQHKHTALKPAEKDPEEPPAEPKENKILKLFNAL
jgi:ATP-dependent Clp protease, protease subunit